MLFEDILNVGFDGWPRMTRDADLVFVVIDPCAFLEGIGPTANSVQVASQNE